MHALWQAQSLSETNEKTTSCEYTWPVLKIKHGNNTQALHAYISALSYHVLLPTN